MANDRGTKKTDTHNNICDSGYPHSRFFYRVLFQILLCRRFIVLEDGASSETTSEVSCVLHV